MPDTPFRQRMDSPGSQPSDPPLRPTSFAEPFARTLTLPDMLIRAETEVKRVRAESAKFSGEHRSATRHLRAGAPFVLPRCYDRHGGAKPPGPSFERRRHGERSISAGTRPPGRGTSSTSCGRRSRRGPDGRRSCTRIASCTYGELDARARRCAARMRELGVEPGDRVAIVTAEKLPFLAAHLGALYAAAVSLPLNPRFTADELRYFLQDSGARVVVVGQDERPVIESLQPELPELRALMSDAEAWDAPEGRSPEPAVDRDDARA